MSYYLRVKFGDKDVPVNPSNLKELTIIQDINKFLPEFRLQLVDTTGALTHTFPFDINMSKIYIEFSPDLEHETQNALTFAVYQREPYADESTPSGRYEVVGLLDIEGLLNPQYSRGFSGTVKSIIESIATELRVGEDEKIEEIEVSAALSATKSLVQPQWNNAQFLKYLKENLEGIAGEYGYKCFIKAYKTKLTFVFKSYSEMIGGTPSYKFILADTPYEDRLPILNYSIFDNYKIYTTLAGKEQGFAYFNYATSEFVTGTEAVQDYTSLSDFWLLDQNDSVANNSLNATGRSNDFTSDFGGYVKSSYSNRLMGLVQMWITTYGTANICPGQMIEIFFPYGIEGDELYSYQYSGYWLIERVVHNFGDHYLTRLLLTRNGLDTDKATTLLKATKQIGKSK